MTLRRLLLLSILAAASASAGCRHGCGERSRLCGADPCNSMSPARLMSAPPSGYATPGYAVGPSYGPPVGVPVSGSGSALGYTAPPNELPFPGVDNIPNPGVPLAPNRPADGAMLPAPQPLTPVPTSPVGLPK